MSYQASTLTSWEPSASTILVESPSTIAPTFLPRQSLETIGSIVNLIVSFWFSLNNLLISSTLVFLFSSKVKSTTEPSAVGTLKALPSSLPSSSGITKPIAFAAPVLDGTIFWAQALPRLDLIPFLWAISRVAWSFV